MGNFEGVCTGLVGVGMKDSGARLALMMPFNYNPTGDAVRWADTLVTDGNSTSTTFVLGVLNG